MVLLAKNKVLNQYRPMLKLTQRRLDDLLEVRQKKEYLEDLDTRVAIVGDRRQKIGAQIVRAGQITRDHAISREFYAGKVFFNTGWANVDYDVLNDLSTQAKLCGTYAGNILHRADKLVNVQLYLRAANLEGTIHSQYEDYAVLFSATEPAIFIPKGEEGHLPYLQEEVEPDSHEWQEIDVMLRKLSGTQYTEK